MRVTTSRYETNFWSTHVNNVRLAEPVRRPVRWQAGFSKSWGLSARVSFLPSPLFHFLALVPFLARRKQKIPFLGLSLLRNQTETLATQAIIILSLCNLFNVCKYLFFCKDCKKKNPLWSSEMPMQFSSYIIIYVFCSIPENVDFRTQAVKYQWSRQNNVLRRSCCFWSLRQQLWGQMIQVIKNFLSY